jgi:uncharacterized protein with NRDE domain
MCLLLFAFKSHPAYKLILAANRDEYYERPTSPSAFWKDAPHLLAGRDLRAGGTWFGITRNGRLAAITNYRDPATVKKNAPSRGNIVTGFLLGGQDPAEYLQTLAQQADKYNGFNLIVGTNDRLYWYSNHGDGIHRLSPGIHGLSNHLLNTAWPKVTRGKDALARLLSEGSNPQAEDLFRILGDRTIPGDKSLPHTGVGLEWERILSPIFITSPTYGTRSSTLLFVDLKNRITFAERTYDSRPDDPTTVRFEFPIEHGQI